jgi:hypothetical protein
MTWRSPLVNASLECIIHIACRKIPIFETALFNNCKQIESRCAMLRKTSRLVALKTCVMCAARHASRLANNMRCHRPIKDDEGRMTRASGSGLHRRLAAGLQIIRTGRHLTKARANRPTDFAIPSQHETFQHAG